MTPTVRLRGLRLRGLCSFVEPAAVEFPDSGLILVDGYNTSTHGRSAAGKTSLLLALSYGVDCCPFPSTELQSWHTEEPFMVEVDLEGPGGAVTVCRGFGQNRVIAGGKTETGAGAVKATLQKLFGDSPEILRGLTYRQQKERGLLLRRTSSERMELLNEVADTWRYEKLADTAGKNARRLELELEAARASLATRTQLLERLPAAKDGELPPEDETALEERLRLAREQDNVAEVQYGDAIRARKAAQAKVVAAARAVSEDPRLSAARAEVTRLLGAASSPLALTSDALEELRADLAKVDGMTTSLRTKEEARHQAHAERVSTWNRRNQELRAAQAREEDVARRLRDARATLQSVQEQRCPSCEQEIRDAGALTEKWRLRVEVLRAEEAAVRTAVSAADAAVGTYPGDFVPSPQVQVYVEVRQEVVTRIAREEERLAGNARTVNAERTGELARARGAVSELEAELERSVQKVREEVELDWLTEREAERSTASRLAEKEVEALVLELEAARRRNGRWVEERERAMAARNELEAEVEAVRRRVEELERSVAAELDLQELLRAWLCGYCEELLASVAREANAMLAEVPNVQQCVVSFDVQRETSTGTKGEVALRVSVGGHDVRHTRSGLSGGMETVVDLAVDLAFARIVSERTDCRPGWVVLDEAFTGLGPREKEACMKILQRYAEDRLVIVVDHGTEFRASFERTVMVEGDGERSRVVDARPDATT